MTTTKPTPPTVRAWMTAKGACAEGIAFVKQHGWDLRAAWEACPDAEWMIWLLIQLRRAQREGATITQLVAHFWRGWLEGRIAKEAGGWGSAASVRAVTDAFRNWRRDEVLYRLAKMAFAPEEGAPRARGTTDDGRAGAGGARGGARRRPAAGAGGGRGDAGERGGAARPAARRTRARTGSGRGAVRGAAGGRKR